MVLLKYDGIGRTKVIPAEEEECSDINHRACGLGEGGGHPLSFY